MIKSLRRLVRAGRDRRQVAALKREWRRISSDAAAHPELHLIENDVLLIPPEPISLIGSKGDEAMLVSVISHLKSSGRNIDVAVGETWSTLPESLIAAGANAPLPIWDYKIELGTVLPHLKKYKEIILIGADVMDGYYSASKSYRFLMIADIATKLGRSATITGFSFNTQPAAALREIPFAEFARETRLCLRDPISLDRFRKITNGLGTLTADVAFLLQPETNSPRLSDIQSWAVGRREAGQFILGFNIHPALLPNDEAAMRGLIEASSSALLNILERGNVGVIFISHDARATSSDSLAMQPVYDRIRSKFPDRVRFITADHSAAELKAVAGLTDAVFTGRMHLSIAALGMGVPVAWATYQGKFEGLAQHFGLPAWLLFDPAEARLEPHKLQALLERMIASQPDLSEDVANRLRDIKLLASTNLPGAMVHSGDRE